MGELGIEASPLSVAQHYRGLIDGFVLDVRDCALKPRFDVPVCASDTFMVTVPDRERLAREVLDFALSLGRSRRRIS
jgi:LPPG:FO 2-phospho-L-lactate transferase